jgi:hypothetical protein
MNLICVQLILTYDLIMEFIAESTLVDIKNTAFIKCKTLKKIKEK